MTDTALLFFIGAAGVVALSRVVALLQRPGWFFSPRIAYILLAASLVGLAAVIALGAVLAWPAWDLWRFYGWTLLRSAVLGCWIAFLAGCLAGFVIAAAINAIVAWGPQANISNILMLAAGPALTILFLYILAMPGVMQGLGLTGIKAGGVEITLSSPPTQGVRADVASYTRSPSEGGGGFADEYTPWFNNIWPMFRALSDTKNKKFSDLGYFQREAAYLANFDRLTVPMTTEEAKHDPPTGVAQRIWEQEEFLRSLRPVYGCGGFYHLIFPDVPSLRPRLTPFLETLVAIETEFEAISSSISIESRVKPTAVALKDVPPEWVKDFLARQLALEEQAGDLVQRFRAAIPHNARSPNPIFTSELPEPGNEASPNWHDCNSDGPRLQTPPNEKPKLDLNRLTAPNEHFDGTIQPPYLAMLIGNTYAALGEKDAGLKVLNAWIKYYKSYGGDFGKDKPRWLYDRAVWEYGVIQEANEPLPTTAQELRYLEFMLTQFSHWDVDLDNEGYKCDDSKAQADLQAKEQAKINVHQPTKFSAGLRGRLFDLYSNLLHRLLYATIETLPSPQHERITPEHEHWARQLIASAEKCPLDESPRLREDRQPQALFSGGVILARWAEDGPRKGFLHPSTVEDVRKEALHALLTALPLIVAKEKADEEPTDGPFRTSPSQWGSNRRIAERTILDLEAKLTK